MSGSNDSLSTARAEADRASIEDQCGDESTASVVSDDTLGPSVILTPTTSAAPSVYNDDNSIAVDGKVLHIVRFYQGVTDGGNYSWHSGKEKVLIETIGKQLTVEGQEIITSDGSFAKKIVFNEPSEVEKDAIYRWEGCNLFGGAWTKSLEGSENATIKKLPPGAPRSKYYYLYADMQNPKTFDIKDKDKTCWLWEALDPYRTNAHTSHPPDA